LLIGSISMLVSKLILISLISKLINHLIVINEVVMKWNVKRKRWWLGYGFKGDEDHIDYTFKLYWWGVYQMFSSNS
jgi:hypothetical protein